MDIFLILHAYQPPIPIQEEWVLKRIVKNCYRPVAELALENPNMRFNLNITGCLTSMLKAEYEDVLHLYDELVRREQIEILQTPSHHPIIPFEDPEMVREQIKYNYEINSSIFSKIGSGFFAPELALDNKSIDLIGNMGFKFTIVAENSLPDHHIRKHDNGLHLLSRDKSFSNAISFRKHQSVEEYVDKARKIACEEYPITLAMDIETFGEHQAEYYEFMVRFLNNSEINSVLGHELTKYKAIPVENLQASSWSTDDKNRFNGIPFPLWRHPNNEVHQLLHANLKGIRENWRRIDEQSRDKLYSAFHSCQFWWASGERRWSWDMVRKGLEAQNRVRKILRLEVDPTLLTDVQALMLNYNQDD